MGPGLDSMGEVAAVWSGAPPAVLPRTTGVALALSLAALLLIGGPGALLLFALGELLGNSRHGRRRRTAGRLRTVLLLGLCVAVGGVLLLWSFDLMDAASPVSAVGR